MKHSLFKGKSTRTKLFTVITVATLLVFFALNLLITYFGIYDTLFLDLTPEGLYTLSDAMKEECSFVRDLKDENGNPRAVKITFCADPDSLTGQTMLRPIFYMAIELHNAFPENVQVETVNVGLNPTAVAAYKTTSLSTIKPNDVIISYGDTYRIIGAPNFWTTGSAGNLWSFNGEYRMASVMMSVTAINSPAAYFLTGHGESVFDPADPTGEGSVANASLYDLLTERGLTVRTLDLSTVDAVPDDCALLVINNPTSDFTSDPARYTEFSYISDMEKIDRYVVNRNGAVMLTKDYGVTLPALEEYLSEWGIGFGKGQITDAVSSLEDEGDTDSLLIAKYSTDEASFGYAIYEDFATRSSSPRMIISDTGRVYNTYGDSSTVNDAGTYNSTKTYASFLTSSIDAQEKVENGAGELVLSAMGEMDLCAVSTRRSMDSVTAEYTYGYVFAAASPDFFSNDLLGNASYANYDIVSALVKNISRADLYASTGLGGLSLNSASYGGKQLVDMKLSESDWDVVSPDAKEVLYTNKGISRADTVFFTVLAAIAPVGVAVLGAVLCIRRKFL